MQWRQQPCQAIRCILLLEVVTYSERGSSTVKINLGIGGNTEVIVVKLGSEYLLKQRKKIRGLLVKRPDEQKCRSSSIMMF